MKSLRGVVSLALVVAIAVSACSADDDGPGTAAENPTENAASAEPSASAEAAQAAAAEPRDDRAESRKPDESGRQTAVFNRIGGNDTGACIDASQRNVRSGGFMVGPFDDARKSWGKAGNGLKKYQVRLYWVPLHAKKMPGVTITATHEGSGSRVTVTEDKLGEAQSWKYYPVVIALPEAGTWVLRGKSGADAGCFTMTVG